jgi:hypothetical protein
MADEEEGSDKIQRTLAQVHFRLLRFILIEMFFAMLRHIGSLQLQDHLPIGSALTLCHVVNASYILEDSSIERRRVIRHLQRSPAL